MATATVTPTVDHAAIDAILTHLERRYGFDPRVDRAYRLFMAGAVEILTEQPQVTGMVKGSAGQSYWVSLAGYCECPDSSANGNTCKHRMALTIAVQMRAVERAKTAPKREDAQFRSHYLKLCTEHQQHGRELIARGYRPIDDAVYLERDLQIQQLKAQLPVPTLR